MKGGYVKLRTSLVPFLLLSVAMFTGCSDNATSSENGKTPDTDPSFASDIQPIFNSFCATSGCHDNANSTGTGLILTSGNSYDNLVSVASIEVASLNLVEPGEPDNSYLVGKIEGTQAVGDRMPQGRSPLSAENIQLIRTWIEQGAENN